MNDAHEQPGAPGADGPRRRRGWVLAAAVFACAVPIAVAAIALATKGWVPVGELAQAELRVRDFWGNPPPLGAVGRLRTAEHVTSHPGPAAWWGMYPVYALFGRSAVALSAAVAATAVAWIGVSITILWRRLGDAGALLGAVVVLGLIGTLGSRVFIEPWNPWFALMPFLCVLIASWDMLEGGRWSSVVVAVAGSYCIQSHFGYLPLVGFMALVGTAGMLWRLRQTDQPLTRALGPLATAVGAAFVIWLPPLIEQLRNSPGNFSLIIEAYQDESGRFDAFGLVPAAKMAGAYLNVRAPFMVLTDVRPAGRSPDLGTLALMVAWVLAVIVAVRRRSEASFASALRMHVVAAAAVLISVVAMSRVVGEVFGYLILFLAETVAMVILAVLWTAWLGVRDHGGPAKVVGVGAVAFVALAPIGIGWAFSDPAIPSGHLEQSAASLIGPVSDSLDENGTYLLRWSDPQAFGGIGTAVMSELERQGFEIGVDPHLSVEMRPHRVLDEDDTDGVVWVITGAGIEEWRSAEGFTEVAYVDHRSEAELSEANKQYDALYADLVEIGGTELAVQLDSNLWAARTDQRVPDELADRIDRFSELGLPTAVFLSDPWAIPPQME